MAKQHKLPVTEELDFHYLLELMSPLHDVSEFSWLPELFATVGHDSLLLLCKYAGGETIRIPTLEELSNAVCAMQWFYDVYIKCAKSSHEIPTEVLDLVFKIKGIYDARNN